MGHPRYTAAVLSNWGELYILREVWDEARRAFHKSLEIAKEIHLQELAANALYGLARTATYLGDSDETRKKGEQSLVAYQEIDNPKTVEVKERLKSL